MSENLNQPTDEEIVTMTLSEHSSFGFIVERYEEKLKRYINRLGVHSLKSTRTLIALILLCHFHHGFIELHIMKL